MDSNELISQLSQDAKATKAAPHAFTLAGMYMLASIVYVAVILSLLGVRSDLSAKLDAPLYASEIALLIAMLGTSCLSSALLAYPDMYQKKKLLWLPVIVFCVFAALLAFAWHADNPPAAMPEHGYYCTVHITLMALVPAGIIFWLTAKMASTHAARAGAATLLTAFSIGALIARLREETDSIEHVVEWHYLPMLAAALLGTLLGKWLLRW